METNIIKGDNNIIVQLIGRLDTASAPEFSDEIEDIIQEKNDVVFDCEKLEYIASSGLRALLQAHKSLTAVGGTLKLINIQPTVQSVLDMTGFSLIMNLEG
ncbi:MAG: STAS domain-containing protein [Prevotella sp.]|nr:STAS domain-containing protein [Prevotella sp.]